MKLALLAAIALLFLLPSSALAQEPVYGGTLVIGRSSDAITLDPNDGPDGRSSAVAKLIAEPLVRFRPGTSEVEPWLATSWSVSDDGLEWTFQLRDGVKFHDGTPFNAEAVVFTFLRMLDKDHPYHYMGAWVHATGLFSNVKDVVAVDDLTVKFVLAKPYSPFLTALTNGRAAIVSPTAVVNDPDNFFKNPIGTGPYVIKEWRTDERIVLERFEGYWSDRPYLDSIIFQVIPESVARILALQRGDIQAVIEVDAISRQMIESSPGLVLQETPGILHGYLTANVAKAPWDDVRVRQALFHALDRQALADAFYPGGAVARGVMSQSFLGFDEDIPWYDYDPEEARRLLAEAGYPNGFATTLYTVDGTRPHTPQPRAASEAIQSYLAAVGIRVEIVVSDTATYLDAARAGEHGLLLAGFSPIMADPWTVMYTQFDSRRAVLGSANNFSFYRNPEVDALNDLADAAAEPEQRAAYYRQIQEIVYRDAVRVDLADMNDVLGLRAEVHDFYPDRQAGYELQYTWLGK